MATVITTKRGKKVVLLNPSEKGKSYARQLKRGTKRDGTKLTRSQASFRMGYLQAREDSAKAFRHNKKKGGFFSLFS